MWRHQGLVLVWVILLLCASAAEQHCASLEEQHLGGDVLLQQSFSSSLSLAGQVIHQEHASGPGESDDPISKLESLAPQASLLPEGELSYAQKIAFIAVSVMLLLASGAFTTKLVQDYEAAASASTPPWYTDARMLLNISSVLLSTWLSLGLAAFTQVILFNDPPRHLTVIESFYLSAQIVTTVGYGDFTPSLPEGQFFLACYIILGVTLVAVLVAELVDHAISHSSAPAPEPSPPVTHQGGEQPDGDSIRSRNSMAASPSGLDSDGTDGVCRRHSMAASSSGLADAVNSVTSRRRAKLSSLSSMTRKLAPRQREHPRKVVGRALTFFVLSLVVGTLFFHFYPGENKSIWLSFYMCCVSLTTVGFGSIHPVTQGGYLFATFWMIMGVACTANMIGTLGDSLMKHRKDLTGAMMKDELLKAMDQDGSGTVDKIEFLKFEMVRKGFCQLHEIESVLDLFNQLDSDGSGELDLEDMKQFAEQESATVAGS